MGVAYLDIHKIIDACSSKFWELLSTFLQECTYFITFLTLYRFDPRTPRIEVKIKTPYLQLEKPVETHHHTLAMPTPIPE
jgi:hypothetical protein